MFVTFFSYKGGVGRTLALANVAYLLANSKQEPCKVLLWDFDLEAPGLQQIFKIKKPGFVDLIYKYITEAKIPTVKDYIYPTKVHNNIDILPAGRISKEYSKKLENINWINLYSKARGYDFIQNLKNQLEEQKYDYVLIDSRTGYSDVGNICVNQLPDLVALFFRLNNQNIEGTKEVYNIIKNANKKRDKIVTVIPVMSPFWPYFENSHEAREQIEKAHKLFSGVELFPVNFDSSLTYQERILCRDIEKSKIKITPKIYEDYSKLTEVIRSSNSDDPITIARQASKKRRARQCDEAFKLYLRLIELRPDNPDYWRGLLDSATLERNKKLFKQLEENISLFIEKHQTNYLPFFTRAELRGLSVTNKDDPSLILQDYNTAIDLAKDNEDVLIGRARFYINKIKNFSKAINDLDKVIGKNLKSSRACFWRGKAYFEKEDYIKAAEDFLNFSKLNPDDKSIYPSIARAQFLARKYNEAKESISRCLKTAESQMLYSHIMAALGNKQESLAVIENVKNKSYFIPPTDIAEICIINFELDKAAEFLDEINKSVKAIPPDDKIIFSFLNTCILILKNAETQQQIQEFYGEIEKQKDIIEEIGWSFKEMKCFLLNGFEKKLISAEQKSKIEALIKKLESPPSI